MVIEELLQLLVGEVDTQLFKAVELFRANANRKFFKIKTVVSYSCGDFPVMYGVAVNSWDKL